MIIKKMTTAQRLVDEIMDDFDYEKVQKVMEYLNWKWYPIDGQIPSVTDLKKKSRELLYDVIEHSLKYRSTCLISAGGFNVEAVWDDEEFKLDEVNLKFILESNGALNS